MSSSTNIVNSDFSPERSNNIQEYLNVSSPNKIQVPYNTSSTTNTTQIQPNTSTTSNTAQIPYNTSSTRNTAQIPYDQPDIIVIPSNNDNSQSDLNIVNYIKKYQVISANKSNDIKKLLPINGYSINMEETPLVIMWYVALFLIFYFLLVWLLDAYGKENRLIRTSKHKIKSLFSPNSLQSRLANIGWCCITTTWCGWSNRQKEVIGDDYIYITDCDTVDSSSNPISIHQPSDASFNITCDQIKSYPTWFNCYSGQIIPGFMSEDKLETIC